MNKILATAATPDLAKALAAFAEAGAVNGGYAPAALKADGEIRPQDLPALVGAAHDQADAWARDDGATIMPQRITVGEAPADLLAAAGISGPAAAYSFGGGSSVVTLLVPERPPFAVVAFLANEDSRDTGEAGRRAAWGQRMAPVEKLAAA